MLSLFIAPVQQSMYNAIASCIMNGSLLLKKKRKTEVLNRVPTNGDLMCKDPNLREAFPPIKDLDKHFWVVENLFHMDVRILSVSLF